LGWKKKKKKNTAALNPRPKLSGLAVRKPRVARGQPMSQLKRHEPALYLRQQARPRGPTTQ
jgi:hypothetical protein